MKAILVALALALGGCQAITAVNTAANTPVTAAQVASARDVSYGLEASYDVALRLAVLYGKEPTCGPAAPPAPLCKTLAVMEGIEVGRAKFRSSLNRLNAVIADTTTTTSMLSAAIDLAKGAYAEYQAALPAVK
jgi:hypothetical protein